VSSDDSGSRCLAGRHRAHPDADGLFEMGGRGAENEAHMVTEGAIRGFYNY
jgi:hypothetical protein